MCFLLGSGYKGADDIFEYPFLRLYISLSLPLPPGLLTGLPGPLASHQILPSLLKQSGCQNLNLASVQVVRLASQAL